MKKVFKGFSSTAGLAPGTLVHVGQERTSCPRISVMVYDEKDFSEMEHVATDECPKFRGNPGVTWINVDGVHDTGLIASIGDVFDLHPLVLEDIVNTAQRPRYEDHGDYVFLVIKMIYEESKDAQIISEQVSIILGKNFVLSFQENEGDVFDSIRDRIRRDKGRVRKMGSDYLTYLLIDSVVDNYFKILENAGEKVESVEEVLVNNPTPEVLHTIHGLKRGLITLRRSVWPLREMISSFLKTESRLVKKTTGIYLRDVYEHAVQVIDTVETYRDMVSGMLDIYLSSISNRMNEVMKFLTIFASIFIPLTFIAGVYGMNFQYMPELERKWAYFAVLGLMAAISAILLLYFRRKKWL